MGNKRSAKGVKRKVNKETFRNSQAHYKEIVNTNQHWIVDKPSIYNFFRAHDASEIMPLFCSLDNVWGDLLQNLKTYGYCHFRLKH
ncbi:hypothetical protein [Ectobacillus panaciterrae]|uniref:hypothetical protein n=1 Tax=Ectobacillus panaciterrae TaxID=363872 RepID=UPI00041DD56F|nr:hypothetical protein [Ectobacillus panaciterrae]